MTQVTFKGTPTAVKGNLPVVGEKLAETLVFTAADLADVTLADFKGSPVVLNVFPSVDTGVCAFSVREFNQKVNDLPGVVVLCVSADLPFAQGRFCAAEGLDKVQNLSTFRHPETLEGLGLLLAEGPLAGLAARAVVVLDKDLTVKHVDLSPEIGEHVNYEAAEAAVKALL